MALDHVTGLVTALTALVIAVGGALTALKLLREVKVGNALTKVGNAKTDIVHAQLNSQKKEADQYQEDLRTALQDANITIPLDASLSKEVKKNAV
jgi:hypothetical protein